MTRTVASPPRAGQVVIVTVDPTAGQSAAARLQGALEPRGPAPSDCRWHGPTLFSFKVPAGLDEGALPRVEALPEVTRVVTLPAAGRLVRGDGPLGDTTRVEVGGVPLGEALTVLAGPCTVESEDQVLRTADLVADAGARVLRGGVFKARTSPYAFGGLGERGLELLAKAREATGLPVVTEALESGQLDLVAQYADMIQIGSRNMQNFPLLFEAGAHPAGRPILLKRGLAATIDEFLQAAEYVLLGRLQAGHARADLVLCERGIRTFDDATRFTLDVGAIPVLQQRCALPVIADPSHAAGARPLVAPLGRASVAAGAAGLLVEVHPEPETALCDGAQSLDRDEFRALMADLNRFAAPRLEG